MTRRDWIGFAAGLLIGLLYVGARAFFYQELPLDEVSWEFRDTLMNGPRLVGFVLAIIVGVRLWGRVGLGFHFRQPREAIWMGLLAIAVFHVAFELRPDRHSFGHSVLGILAVSSLCVALFEETLFRGVIYRALAPGGSSTAIIGSAILFTAYHVQAQELVAWPSIFLWGLVFGLMVSRGIGIGWTIIIHALFDATVFFGTRGPPPPVWLTMMSFGAELTFVAGYMLRKKNIAPAPRLSS